MTDQQAVADQVRGWIVRALTDRPDITGIALTQRAKFEGWLKFELACLARREGATDVVLEARLPAGNTRADIGFTLDGTSHFVELKTPNTNWRTTGVEAKARPMTKNIDSVIVDGRKMQASGGGIVAFTLFPVPRGDNRWKQYLHRIGDSAEIVVCSFWTQPRQ